MKQPVDRARWGTLCRPDHRCPILVVGAAFEVGERWRMSSEDVAEQLTEAAGDTRLNWIVPCRRAAVAQSKITYVDAVDRWIGCLYVHRDSMQRWYPLTDGEFNRG